MTARVPRASAWFRNSLCIFGLLLALSLVAPINVAHASTYVEGMNQQCVPGQWAVSPDTRVAHPYVPGQTYELSRIEAYFMHASEYGEPAPLGSGRVTVSIWPDNAGKPGERPLAHGDFSVDRGFPAGGSQAGYYGVDLSPAINVVAGQKYWISYDCTQWTYGRYAVAGSGSTADEWIDRDKDGVFEDHIGAWLAPLFKMYSGATGVAPIAAGSNVGVTAGGTNIVFSSVNTPGTVQVTPATSGHDAPANFSVLRSCDYEISTTAGFTGSFTITVPYDEANLNGKNESNLKLLHWKNNGWEDITLSVDTVNNTITGRADSFSPFTVGTLDDAVPTVSTPASSWWSLSISIGIFVVALSWVLRSRTVRQPRADSGA